MITVHCAVVPGVRLNRLLKALGVVRSVRHARRQGQPRKRGGKPEAVPAALAAPIRALAGQYPSWGYKRIAIIAGRRRLGVSNKQVYRLVKAGGPPP